MNCPDIERLLDLTLGAAIDPETEAHVKGCADCRALTRFVIETEAAFTPAIEAPEALVAATVEALITEADSTALAGTEISFWEAMQTGMLAAATVLVVGIATDSFTAAPIAGVIACVLSGVAAVVYEVREAPRTV